jgi:hypothetical protein
MEAPTIMEASMPRPRPPGLHREIARGKIFWYVRISHGPRIRLRAAFGSDEFSTEYHAAVAALTSGKTITINPETVPVGSLAWLIERYCETSAWTDLSLATRRQRENIFKQIIATAGQKQYAKIDSAIIEAGRDRRKEIPRYAARFVPLGEESQAGQGRSDRRCRCPEAEKD